MIFQCLPLHEQPVALRHLVRSLQSHKFAALGTLENRRSFLHAGFELGLHAGFHIDLCNLKNHGRKLPVCLATALWGIGRLLQRADSCAGISERSQPPQCPIAREARGECDQSRASHVPPSVFWNGMSLVFIPKKAVTSVGGSRHAVRIESVNNRRFVTAIILASSSSSNRRARSCIEPTSWSIASMFCARAPIALATCAS